MSGASGEPFVVEVVNVSTSGLGVSSVKPLHVGQAYLFKITGWKLRPIKGLIRWVEGEGPTYAGIEFVEVTRAQRDELDALIAQFDVEDWGQSTPRKA